MSPDGNADDPLADDPPSQWGRINARQKYSILTLDLDRAIAAANLRRYESILLEQARELGWHGAIKEKRGRGEGWPNPKPAHFNLQALSKATGIRRRHLFNAKMRLIASRIFILADDDGVWINKRADEWIVPESGKRRLGPKALDWCREVQVKIQARLPLGAPDPALNGAHTLRSTGRIPCAQRGAYPALNGAHTLRSTGRIPCAQRGARSL